MKRIFALVLVVVLALTACGAALAEETILTIHGSGVVNVTADQVNIVLGVREVSEDVLQAQLAVNEKINAIYDALIAAGIETKDIGTQNIYIYANYDYSEGLERIVGYTARNSLSIIVNDIERAGEFIDIAFAAGANELDNVSFTAKDTEAAKHEALKLAMLDAQEKAQVIAEAAGLSVGEIKTIVEDQSYYYGAIAKSANFRAEAEDMAAGTSIQAASLQVSAALTVEFVLEK